MSPRRDLVEFGLQASGLYHGVYNWAYSDRGRMNN